MRSESRKTGGTTHCTSHDRPDHPGTACAHGHSALGTLTVMFRFPNDPSPDGLANLECSLEIHRSSSLDDACRVLSRFLIEQSYVMGFRASTGFSDDERRRDLLIEHRETAPCDASESHIAVYEIDLPHGDLLRLELSLPTSSGVGAQATIEGMLAHLETFCWIQPGAALGSEEESNARVIGRSADGEPMAESAVEVDLGPRRRTLRS